jgi:protein required for attachment to host cells
MVSIERQLLREDQPSENPSDASVVDSRQRWTNKSDSTPSSVTQNAFEEAVQLIEGSPSPESGSEKQIDKQTTISDAKVNRATAGLAVPRQTALEDGQMLAPSPLLPNSDWASAAEHAWRRWAWYAGAASAGVLVSVMVCLLATSLLLRDGEEQTLPQRSESASEDLSTIEEEAGQDSVPDSEQTGREAEDVHRSVESNKDSVNQAETGVSTEAPADSRHQVSEPVQEPDESDPSGDIRLAARPSASHAVEEQTSREEDFSTENKVDPLPSVISSQSVAERREYDVAARLKDTIQQIEFVDVRLVDFVYFLSDFSTLPITIDPEAVFFAGKSPATKLQVKLTDTTVQQTLHEVLAKKGLESLVRDDHLVITAKMKQEDRSRRVEYPTEDLLNSQFPAQEDLARWLRTLVAPTTWQDQNGSGTIEILQQGLAINQPATIQWQVLQLFDKLRLARGGTPRSPYSPKRFVLSSRSAQAHGKLSQLVTLNYFQPARLTEVLQRLSTETGVYFLVDWLHLDAAGWWPDSETTFQADQQTLRESMEAFLSPKGLAFRIVDGKTLQITTELFLQRRYELEFYDLSKVSDRNQDSQELLVDLQELIGRQHFGPGRGVLFWDQKSRYLVARLPQSLQFELEVEVDQLPGVGQ